MNKGQSTLLQIPPIIPFKQSLALVRLAFASGRDGESRDLTVAAPASQLKIKPLQKI